MTVRRAWLRDRKVFVQLVDQSGLSERELARMAGLGHATVNHLVSGRRNSVTLHTAGEMAKILGVAVETVFVTI